MKLKNFDLTTDEIIRNARKRAIVYMVTLAAFIVLCGYMTVWMLPNNVKITIGLVASGVMLLVTFSLLDRLAKVMADYFSDTRVHMEDEIASRMIYLKNMTDKNKEPFSRRNETVQ